MKFGKPRAANPNSSVTNFDVDNSPDAPRPIFLQAATVTVPHACHAKRRICERFPTPARRIHVRAARDCNPHTRHVNRASNTVKMHDSPRAPGIHHPTIPKEPHASRAPRLPRDTRVHHPLSSDSPIPYACHAKRPRPICCRVRIAALPHACCAKPPPNTPRRPF